MMRSLAERKRIMRPVFAAAPRAKTLARRATRVVTERGEEGETVPEVEREEAISSVTKSIMVPMLNGTDIVTADETKRSPMPPPMRRACGLASANNLKSVSLSLTRLGFLLGGGGVVVGCASLKVFVFGGPIGVEVEVVESRSLNDKGVLG